MSTASRIGVGIQITPSTIAPTRNETRGMVWVSDSDGLLYYTDPDGNDEQVSLWASTAVQPETITYSFVDSGSNRDVGDSAAGNFTVGAVFVATTPMTITGARFYWSGANKTVKVSIWNAAGSVLATVNQATTGSAIYTVTFASPVSITTSGTYRDLTIGMYDTSAAVYQRITAATHQPASSGTQVFMHGRGYGWISNAMFLAGDAKPTSAGSETYPIEPVFTVP
jgi:hypothetical protein